MGTGSSRWNFARRYAIEAGSRSSPAIATAGSPGSSCCSPKMRIETKNSVGTIAAMRARRKRPIDAAALELQSLEPHEPVGHGLEARELARVRPQPVPMEEIDDRLVLRLHLRDLLEELRALLRVRRGARLRHELVGVGAAPSRIVEGLLARKVAE